MTLDFEQITSDIYSDLSRTLGGHYHVVARLILNDSVIGFVAKPTDYCHYEVMFFNTIDLDGGYYHSNLLGECAEWAIPYIQRLFTDGGFTLATVDVPDEPYRNILIMKENPNDQ